MTRRINAGVRVRTTATAVAVVGLVLIAASAAMVWQLRRSLTDNILDTARLTAEGIASTLASDELGSVIMTGDEDEEFVQVIASDGTVVASTANLSGPTPAIQLQPGTSTRVEEMPFEDGPFIVVAVEVPTDEGPRIVVVGRTLEPVSDTTSVVIAPILVGVPLLLLVVAAVTWTVVGRALAPVDSIRNEVQEISSARLDRRVPVPASKDEIARLAITMNDMLDRLEQEQDRQRRFVSDASHELRSPIAAIRQHVEVTLAHPELTDDAELADVVLAEDLRLQSLVENLLLLTRMDEGTLTLRRAPVDLDDIVLDEASRLRASASEPRVDTRRVAAERVIGDEEHLRRLVRNLMDNAQRHARSTVTVSLDRSGADAYLTVDDDGAGVPGPDRRRIFERFTRLDEARDRDSGGSGLGLSIVLEIAQAHDGTVVVSDAPTGGARFEVRLPLADDG